MKQLESFLAGCRDRLYQNDAADIPSGSAGAGRSLGPSTTEAELPFHAKYMLIAAYLVSNNPKDTDVRLLSRGGGPKRRRKHQLAQVSRLRDICLFKLLFKRKI